MSLYVSKPQQVEAVQWRGDNRLEVLAFGILEVDTPSGAMPIPKVTVDELTAGPVCRLLLSGAGGAQEWVPVPVGHWLVNKPGDKTDIWPVDPDYFAATYRPAEYQLPERTD